MIVYFAGVNTRHFCEAFIGRHVLETFVDPRQKVFGRYRALFGSIALDCGAYSAMTKKIKIDIVKYGDFVERHGAGYRFCASLDDIRGGVSANVANYETLRKRGLRVMPTWHQGEPPSLLEDYCRDSEWVGLGFCGRPITDAIGFLDDAFGRIPSGTKTHGWAMTNYTADYPFASVDSKTWLHELLALRDVVPEKQKSFGLEHLTDGELIEIVQKKYDRQPKTDKWTGPKTLPAPPRAEQIELLQGVA